jgi:uncharacterized protein (TIGR03086 family)
MRTVAVGEHGGMSDISERYRRLAAAVTEKVAAVATDRWESASPCEGWTARDVVRHLVDVQGVFLGLAGRELGPVPSVDQDPLAAWTAASARVQDDLEDPVVAAITYEGQLGTRTFEAAIDQFVSFDLLVHGWDLARAAGLDDAMPADEVAAGLAGVEGFGDALASSGMFGTPVDVPADADAQTRLLAALGRDARST